MTKRIRGALYYSKTEVDAQIAAKADDLGADDNYVTDAEKVKLSNLSGTNTGDQNLAAYILSATAASTYEPIKGADDNFVTDAEKVKLTNLSGTNSGDQTTIAGITGTKAQFDTAVTDGNILYVGDVTTNATHTGDVTGSDALTIASVAITGKTAVTAVGTDYILISDTSDSGNLKKALASDLAGGPGGGGGTGVTEVDFGAFPGASDTSLAITGQAAILAGSSVSAWVMPKATTDHSADEHWVESIAVMAGNVSAGVGFTIYARNDSQVFSQPQLPRGGSPGDNGTRLYGKFAVAWEWQ